MVPTRVLTCSRRVIAIAMNWPILIKPTSRSHVLNALWAVHKLAGRSAVALGTIAAMYTKNWMGNHVKITCEHSRRFRWISEPATSAVEACDSISASLQLAVLAFPAVHAVAVVSSGSVPSLAIGTLGADAMAVARVLVAVVNCREEEKVRCE